VRIKAQAARWGLLVTTIAMGVVLVFSGVSGYYGARRSAASLTRSLALDTLVAVRRSLAAARLPDTAALKEVLADLGSQGLTYVAILAPRFEPLPPPGSPGELPGPPARIVAEAGQAAPAAVWQSAALAARAQPHVDLLQSPDARQVRLVAPLMPGPGPGPGGGPRPGRGFGRGPFWPPGAALPEPGPPPPGMGLPPGPPGPGLVVECAPPWPRTLTTRALLTLGVDVGAAVLLLAAALFFWRQSRRAERYAAQLEREQRLAALGQMSAVLGHELRNPLASLKGHAQLLLEKLPEEHPGRPGAARVVREAVRLEELAGQVLEFVRTGQVSAAPADPVATARAAVETVAGAEIQLDVGDAPGTWLFDRPRVESVLVNLLRNAVAASPAGAAVEVRIGVADAALVYEVRDRGEGLEAGDEERVFEPFFTRRAKGTGLGLAVARRVVEGHGGTITATRREGGGTTFRVALPARPPAAPA
jgi:two-component system, NtrC family, sensor histidine kinase HydH